MAVQGPLPNKLLMILDLDYTHYYTNKTGIVMLGEANRSDGEIVRELNLHVDFALTFDQKVLIAREKAKNWLHFYQQQVEIAKASGIQLIFGIVTNKEHYDDLVEHAVIAFKELLEPGHPGVYVKGNNQDYCLVKEGNSYHYENLEKVEQLQCMENDPFSPIIVVYKEAKAPHILSIAHYHGIPPEHCLLVDDTPDVILNAESYGIRTVSFAEFCPTIHDEKEKLELFAILDDHTFVQTVVKRKRLEIEFHIQEMIHSVQQKRQSDPSDPFDILYSWGSYRLRDPLAKLVLSYSEAIERENPTVSQAN
ncbi:MAG TPA: hypothetical protein PLD88_03025, partial [Candidatus Berkiella sp.]|nr:hypothetical protein [Candidatus Berkiella sp.]